MCDLTGNELWSREEFRLFNLLTSDQELDDAEWQVVEGLSVSLVQSCVLLLSFVVNFSFFQKTFHCHSRASKMGIYVER